MEPEFTVILQKIIAEQGRETFLNTAKCKALLADYTKNEHKKESRLLLQALDVGVHKAIDTAENITICKKQQIRLLHEDYGMDEKMAADIVDTLALVLRGDEPKSWVDNLTRSCGLLAIRNDGVKIVRNIILLGTVLPAHREREFLTSCANQTVINLQVFENKSRGEEATIDESKPVFKWCKIKLTPGLPEGAPIKVIFDFSSIGLFISAVDIKNNVPLLVDVKGAGDPID
jgi:hypothetical protein